MHSFEGNLVAQRHQIISLETRDSRLPHGEDPECLSHLALNPYRVVTDRQSETERPTDRIPIASTRSQQYLPVLLWRVKTWFRRLLRHPARKRDRAYSIPETAPKFKRRKHVPHRTPYPDPQPSETRTPPPHPHSVDAYGVSSELLTKKVLVTGRLIFYAAF